VPLLTRALRIFANYLFLAIFVSIPLWAADPWDGPAFTAGPDALRQAAAAIKADKDADVTILLNDDRYAMDGDGNIVETFHSIYRIEDEEGVKNWAETSGSWEPWHQLKPEIKARVITVDGVVHTLDPKTLSDVPAHQNSPETYSDQRTYGGPLPAISVGAIVEEEIVSRDTAPFFAAGQVVRLGMKRWAPVNKYRVVLSHPESRPLHYVLQQMPDAKVTKSSENGVETITIETGPYPARTERLAYVPPDVVPEPQVEFSTGKSWQDVAAAYARMSSDKFREADVRPLLARLDLKKLPRGAVIRKIVESLHKNVRYTGIEFGESSLIPQFPSETLKRKYGDCKDKATLLATMLRAAGIPARLALLDTGPGQDINTELPGMGMFDHAIVYLPATGKDPEMWIDATAQYTQVGYLPYMDYGRWALIADEKTSELKKIPNLTSAQNLHRETREFTLTEFGPAKIVEINEQVGPDEERLRDFYTGDAKQIRENGEKYVKNMYLADSLISIDHDDLTDMEKPFKVTYVTKGKRGSTDLNSAVMAIRQETIFEGLPSYFYQKEDSSADANKEDKPKPRTADWWIDPFATEWHYKITTPPGFKLRALPPDKEQHLGTALYTQKYTSNADGTEAEAVFRFDSGKQRLTAEEGKVLRDAIVKAREADPIFISFDQIGFSLLSAGKVKEALAADQELAAQHPKEALQRVRLASVLLSAGLGEQARSVAKDATLLDPKSAQAFNMLGWVLEHDLIGRRFKKGFDYAGAVAAYRKARELDPKNSEACSNLGYLLEFDSDGVRYGAKAALEEAAAQMKELKKIDEQEGRRFEDNVLFDLWYARKFKEVAAYAATLPANQTRRSFILAATAAEQGVDTAIRKSTEITTDDQARNEALSNAGFFMMRVQRYPEAVGLLEAATRGQSNGAQVAPLIAMLKKIKPHEELKIDLADPSGAVQELFAEIFADHPDPGQIQKRIASKVVPPPANPKAEEREFRSSMFDLRNQLESSGLPLRVVGDIVLSAARYTKEGDGSGGYRVTLEFPGAEAMDAFVVPEAGVFKLVDFSPSSTKVPEDMAWEVLALLDRKDLAAARKWLDWAREKIHIRDGDDPLSGQPFPHFWTKGQAGDEAAIRTAALVLMASKSLRPEHFAALIQARNQAKTQEERDRLNVALAFGYAAQKKWTELAAIAEALMQAEPDSMIAYDLATEAYGQLKKFDAWEKVLQARLQKHPNDPDYLRSAATLALFRGDVRKSRELLKGLMDRGKATASDLNSYAWDALMVRGPVDQDSMDAAERSNELTKNGNFSIMHTVACLYAETGKPRQARDLLLKAMDAAKLDEPDSAVWFAYGMIAEQYGETEAARTMYTRVEKPESEFPGSTYELAQQRLLALKNEKRTTAKNVVN
jgi:Flp pilus assembly protein TadD